MTDKVQKIREEVVRMHNLLPVMDGDNISVNYADRICTTLEMYIDSLQEKPVSEQNLSNVQRTTKNWKEPVSEELEEAAKHYLYSNILYDDVYVGNPTDKDCIEMFKAGAKWQETKDKQVLNEEGVVVLPEEAFERMKRSLIELAEKEQQMTANAIEGAYIRRNKYTKKNVLSGFDVTCDAIQGFKNGDKIKVIVIKED